MYQAPGEYDLFGLDRAGGGTKGLAYLSFNSFGVNGSISSIEGAKKKGLNLLCIKYVKGKTKATPYVDQKRTNCQIGASNPPPPALDEGSKSGNQYW